MDCDYPRRLALLSIALGLTPGVDPRFADDWALHTHGECRGHMENGISLVYQMSSKPAPQSV
jgi:hypothetical protein